MENLQEVFAKCTIGILTEYRGLSAPEMNTLRRKLNLSGGEYKVVKNTLARLAAEKAGRGDVASLFEGPLAIAFGYEDVTRTAKALTDYIQTAKTKLSVKGGFLSDRVLTSEDVTTISTLPAREVLLARVLGGIQSPLTALVSCLAAPMRNLMGVLQARIQQLEGK